MPRQRVAVWHAALGAALLFGSVCDILPEAAAGLSAGWTGIFFGLGAAASAAVGVTLRGATKRHTERSMRAHDGHGSLRRLLLLVEEPRQGLPAVVGAPQPAGEVAREAAAGLWRCWRREGDVGPGSAEAVGSRSSGAGGSGDDRRGGAGGSGASARSRSRVSGRFVIRGVREEEEDGAAATGFGTLSAAANAALDERREVLAVGLAGFLSLSAHNLLEGMSILLAAQDGMDKGVRLAAAVGIENFPEGVAIALPILYATRCPKTAVRLAFVSGMLEPAGVLLVGVFLRPWMSQSVASSLLAIISGILASLALLQILPLAIRTSSNLRASEFSAWCGIGVISATLLQPLCMFHARVGAVR